MQVRVLKIVQRIVTSRFGREAKYKLPTIEEGGLLPKMNYESLEFGRFKHKVGENLVDFPEAQFEIEDL